MRSGRAAKQVRRHRRVAEQKGKQSAVAGKGKWIWTEMDGWVESTVVEHGTPWKGSGGSDVKGGWQSWIIAAHAAKAESGGSQEKGGGEDWGLLTNSDCVSRGKGPKADDTNVGAAVEQYDRTADFKSKSAVAETEPMEKRGATEGGSSSSATANWWDAGNDNKWRAGAGGSTWNWGR